MYTFYTFIADFEILNCGPRFRGFKTKSRWPPFRHELNELQFLKVQGFDPTGVHGLLSFGMLTSGGNVGDLGPTR